MGFNGDLMGFNGDLMGFNGDLMGFNGDLMGFMGFISWDLMELKCPLNGMYPLVHIIMETMARGEMIFPWLR